MDTQQQNSINASNLIVNFISSELMGKKKTGKAHYSRAIEKFCEYQRYSDEIEFCLAMTLDYISNISREIIINDSGFSFNPSQNSLAKTSNFIKSSGCFDNLKVSDLYIATPKYSFKIEI